MIRYFPKYKGKEGDVNEALEFVRDQFLSKNTKAKDTNMYPHVMIAIESESVRKTMNDVDIIVINCSLERAGLV